MARIPDAELERLKREVSLARLIEGQGLRLVSQGKDLACRCPWHEGDDTPSCIVLAEDEPVALLRVRCRREVIDWVMRSHRVSFRHACELLVKEHPALAAPRPPDDLARRRGSSPPASCAHAQSFARRCR